MGEVGRAIAPQIGKANEDYWNARLTLPGQNAAQRYGMATTYGSTMGNASRQRQRSMYEPLSEIWRTTAAGGTGTPKKPDDPSGDRIASTVGSLASLFA